MKLIMAQSENGVIGPGLPWGKIYEDMVWFRKQTLGKICLVGRVTYEEVCWKLTGRDFAVLGSGVGLREAMALAPHICIGGKRTYELVLENGLITEVLLTVVSGNYSGDLKLDLRGWGKLIACVHYPWGRIERRGL